MPQKTKVAASGNRNKQNIAELKNILKTINSSLNPYDLAVNCLRMSQLMYGLESEREKFTNTYGTKVFQYHMAFIESLYNKVSVSPDILENEKILEFMRIDDFAITLKTVMDLEMAMDSKMENDLEMKNDFPITSPIMHTVISIFAKYEESHHDKLDKNVIKALEEILGPNEQRPDNLRAKETIAICAKIGSFTLAKQYIDCRKNENAQAILKGTAIAALINKGGEVGEQYIRSVLNILDVDIKDFQILGGRYSGARVVIETVCNLFESGSYESAKKILSYFVNIGLPINGNV
ncbi:MAG: hypothetical protein KA998_04145, partial [Rickettsiaceae bacterium]|nr:hypothetical protein [Rickettsiaceae bacterium]